MDDAKAPTAWHGTEAYHRQCGVSLINCFGHCASYISLFELEIAMCRSTDSDTVLSSAIPLKCVCWSWTLHLLYGRSFTKDKTNWDKRNSCNNLVLNTFLTSCDGMDMNLLPPYRDSLRMHIKRANIINLLSGTKQPQQSKKFLYQKIMVGKLLTEREHSNG